jgi:hypothetical protein
MLSEDAVYGLCTLCGSGCNRHNFACANGATAGPSSPRQLRICSTNTRQMRGALD